MWGGGGGGGWGGVNVQQMELKNRQICFFLHLAFYTRDSCLYIPTPSTLSAFSHNFTHASLRIYRLAVHSWLFNPFCSYYSSSVILSRVLAILRMIQQAWSYCRYDRPCNKVMACVRSVSTVGARWWSLGETVPSRPLTSPFTLDDGTHPRSITDRSVTTAIPPPTTGVPEGPVTNGTLNTSCVPLSLGITWSILVIL